MQPVKKQIIAIDDEPNILLSIKSCLSSDDFHVDTCSDINVSIQAMQSNLYDCALIDIRLGGESGVDLFKRMLSEKMDIPVIFMSGNASLKEAVESQKLGAYDFLEKPFSSDKLRLTIENCLTFFQLKNRLSRMSGSQYDQAIIGKHNKVCRLKREMAKVAGTDAAVLINGESGTGKELIANAIHQGSSRSKGELITVNCSAVPENLVESALFGHVKGAFTGADSAKKGYFEQAHNGSVFLDEIGDMPLSAQVSLLRVLESREIQKVGAESIIKVNVRVIAATHKDLKSEVEAGRFRQDLYYRLNVIPIVSPALRERLTDIPLLTTHLVERLCKQHGMPPKKIETACFDVFKKYSWPGNVRELANTLERMVIMGGDKLRVDDIPHDITDTHCASSDDLTLKAYRASAERELIVNRLNQHSGNVSEVARSLDIDRTNLHKKIKLYGIKKESDFI